MLNFKNAGITNEMHILLEVTVECLLQEENSHRRQVQQIIYARYDVR